MKQQVRAFWIFFFSQQLADGIRTTLAVLLPALGAFFFGHFTAGMTISLGAVCVSIVDTPGPIVHRKNSMLFCLLFVFAVAIITGFARLNIYTLGLEIALLSFFFSMFSVYGLRAAFVGTSSLLVLVLTMDQPIEPADVVPTSFMIFCGGLFYMVVSLLVHQVRPYRSAQRALGECIRELARYLRIKADFYNTRQPLEPLYRKLVAQQIEVSEKQDSVRELFFKTRRIVQDPSAQGNRLLLAFIDTVDLFEDITASYYDYALLREQYGDSPVLERIAQVGRQISEELDNMGVAIQTNRNYEKQLDLDAALTELKHMVNALPYSEGEQKNLPLKRILVNIRKMMMRTNDLYRYFSGETKAVQNNNPNDLRKFVGHQSLDPKIFVNNLNFKSNAFKHALRVALASLAGFIIAKWIAPGHHSYWIIMTTIFMLKPSFSLTKQRNFERIVGTLTGGLLGLLLLLFIKDKAVLFALMVLFMLGTYSFQRINYFASVISMTPFILILFTFLGIGFLSLLQERLLDTLIGCLLAFSASYLLFPEWESRQLKTYLRNMLQANTNYLYTIAQMISGKTVTITDYKLARKEVYVSSANLSAAFQRMLSEPKSKQKNEKALHQFVVLNHILFSNIATLAATVWSQHPRSYPPEIIRPVRKVVGVLCAHLETIDQSCTLPVLEYGQQQEEQEKHPLSPDDALLKSQLEFIYRLSCDMGKAMKKIV